MRYLFTVKFFLLVSLIAFAQDNFVPGYYIDNEGKKVDCLIKQLGWANTPQNLRFKLNRKSRPDFIDLQNIKEFAIDGGRKFVKYTVDIDQSFNDEFQDKINASYAVNLETLSTDSLPDWQTQTLLLEIIVEGDVNLLNYKASTKNLFFIKKSNKSPAQLVYKKYKVKSDNRSAIDYITYGTVVKGDTIKENNTYKLQLVENANCTDASLNLLNELQYTYDGLKNFILVHNKCINPNNTKEYILPELKKGKINLYALGRGSFNEFNMRSSIVGVDFESEYAVSGCIEIEYLSPYRNNKWTPFVQFTYNGYGGPSIKTIRNAGSVDIDEKYSFEASALQIPIGLRYNLFLKNKNMLFVDAAFNILINVGDKYASRESDLEYLIIHEKPNFIYGGGFNAGRFRIAVHYQYRRFIKQIAWFSRYRQISLDLGWRIF